MDEAVIASETASVEVRELLTRYKVLNIVDRNRSHDQGGRFPRAHYGEPRKIQELLARTAKECGVHVAPEAFSKKTCSRISELAGNRDQRNNLIIEELVRVGVQIIGN
jgi:transposase